MNEVYLLIVGAAVSGLAQLTKKYWPKLNPLISVGALSIILAAAWVIFKQIGLINPEVLKTFALIGATAVTIYNVLKAILKASSGQA